MYRVWGALLATVFAVGVAHWDGAATVAEPTQRPMPESTISATTDAKDSTGFLDLRFVRVRVRSDGAHVWIGTYDRWATTALRDCAQIQMTWPDSDRKVEITFTRKYGLTYLVTTLKGEQVLRFRVSHADPHQLRFVLLKSAMGRVETAAWTATATSPDRPGHCASAVTADVAPERGYVRP